MVNTNIILKYFDLKLNWKSGIPILDTHLKEEFKKNKPFPLKCVSKNRRVSLTGDKYYVFYLGDEVGKLVYKERNKIRKQKDAVRWYAECIEPDLIVKEKLFKHADFLKTRESEIQSDIKNKFWNSEEGSKLKKKYSNRDYSKLAKSNKEKWENIGYKQKILDRLYKSGRYDDNNHGKKIRDFYANPKNKEFITQSMNNPIRVKKISDKAKIMWDNAKKHNKELYYRMINTSKNKNYVLNGYKMNFLEYEIGKILNEFGLKWEYEKIFEFKTNCYLPDFCVESEKLIVECYGDFWHANPSWFSENQTTHKNRVAKDIWYYDNLKKDIFEKNGYKYLYFWENEIINNLDKIKVVITENYKL